MSAIWWLGDLKRIGKIIWENNLKQKKKRSGLKVYPALALTQLGPQEKADFLWENIGFC